MSKERLVELLHNFKSECGEYCISSIKECQECRYAQLADFLLANGVIVPPCKVGDEVYEITKYYGHIMPRKVVGFHIGNFPKRNGHRRNPYIVCYDKTTGFLHNLMLHEIGKTVFLTREEAEAKLEEKEKE